jgi:hypothetical protein
MEAEPDPSSSRMGMSEVVLPVVLPVLRMLEMKEAMSMRGPLVSSVLASDSTVCRYAVAIVTASNPTFLPFGWIFSNCLPDVRTKQGPVDGVDRALQTESLLSAREDAVDQRAASGASGGDEGFDEGVEVHAEKLLVAWAKSCSRQAGGPSGAPAVCIDTASNPASPPLRRRGPEM